MAKRNKQIWANSLSDEHAQTQKQFYDVRIMHPKMESTCDQLMPLLVPYSESNIIVVTGATGTGKTTLSHYLKTNLFSCYESEIEQDLSAVPVVTTEAYSNGDGRHDMRVVYEQVATQLREPALDKKHDMKIADGKMIIYPKPRLSVPMLRKIVERGFQERKTKIFFIDEAYHLLLLSKEMRVLDTLKSLANTTGVKIVLLGSFDLFDLIGSHGQLARRTSIINFDRYHLDREEDRIAFRKIVLALQAKWPCSEIPNFAAISDALLELTLGCVGLLKAFLLDSLSQQVHNDGVWKPEFLKLAAKSNKLREIIRKEIAVGESKVRDALLGETFWDDKAFKSLVQRMEVAHA